jgi:hypothetical protein
LKLVTVASLFVLAGRLGRAIAWNRWRIAATGMVWAGAALGLLGAVQAEVIFLIGPWGDPAGAIAFGVAGLVTAALLAFWTGTTAPGPAESSQDLGDQ